MNSSNSFKNKFTYELFTYKLYIYIYIYIYKPTSVVAQSAGAVEYIDCTSEEM